MNTLRTLTICLAILCVGCAGEDIQTPSYIVRVRAGDVEVEAVDDLQITISPGDPADQFPPQDGEQLFEDGQVRTTVAGRDFVITYSGAWVRSHLRPEADATVSFQVDLPIYATSDADSPSRTDPTVRASIRRGGQSIADGAAYLRWPLIGGDIPQSITVVCTDGFDAECMNL